MFDMSWGEIMVIGGVALIVIGPKDLPKALRTVGQMTGKVRRMASEFQSQFNEAMREAELEDMKKEVEGLNKSVSQAAAFNPIQTIRDEIRGAGEAKPAMTSDATTPTGNPDAEVWGTNPGPVATDALEAPARPAEPALAPVEEIGPVPHIAPVAVDEPAAPAPLPEPPTLPPYPPAPPAPSTAPPRRTDHPGDRPKDVS